jgi:PUA domain protein
MEIASRHHLRSDAVSALRSGIEDQLGVDPAADQYEHVELADSPFDVVLIDGEPSACYVEDEPFLTVTGANAYPPERRVVTVDAGADVMRPGIVEADDRIEEGDLVVIEEESHGKALAIGRARVSGSDMLGDSGKVVDSIHHVGDELYQFTP